MRIAAIISSLLGALVFCGALHASERPKPTPETLQFRNLFDKNGKPSIGAYMRNGKQVTLVGFMAPPPDMDANFLVFVPEPTVHCPYCTTVNEDQHAAFILVYGDENLDLRKIGLRTRIKVTGKLEARHGYEQTFGFHNDLRLLEATVQRDHQNRRLTPAQLRARAASQKAAELPDPAEIDG